LLQTIALNSSDSWQVTTVPGASSKKGKRRKKEGEGLGIELLTLRTGVVFVVALPHPGVFFYNFNPVSPEWV
jgi:hypothetical protein